MESEIKFILNDGAFWLSIAIGVLGIIIISGVLWFGRKIYDKSTFSYSYSYIIDYLIDHNTPKSLKRFTTDELKAIIKETSDVREKRNEFWDLYGQIVLTIFIVVILAILLITKTISAEAGLPILSAVSGFAIAKGVNSSKGPNSTFNPSDDKRSE